MDDVYGYLYARYEEKYSYWSNVRNEWILSVSIANHKQIDRILKACDADEDEVVVLEAMHSCIGCSGNSVPALD